MNTKPLIPNNLQDGINLTVDNAENLFRAATALAKAGNYGLANSLYVLCCEEAIKAFAIYNNLIKNNEKYTEKIFTSHKEKIEVLKEGYHIMSSETLAMNESFEKAFLECEGKDNIEVEAKAREIYPDIFNRIFNDYQEKDINDNWWNTANISKQNGFYVGFDESGWKGPDNISFDELKVTQEKAKLILGHILQYKNKETAK